MKLLSLHLENFKGHKDLTVNFGDTTMISGRNGTGKTSIFDAFMFVLTEKDSLGRVCGMGQQGEATIRPRKADGELLHEVDVTVKARMVDEAGEVFELKRIYREEYKVDKNSGESIFKGNTTKYYINDAPLTKGKYDAWLKENLNPETYSLTGNPAYFPGLPWQDQRQWLLKITGDVDDDSVIATNPDLGDLSPFLGKHNIADLKAIYSERMKLANKAIQEGVVRIDQTTKLAGNNTEEGLERELSGLQENLRAADSKVEDAEAEIAAAKSGNRAGQIQVEIRALDVELDKFRATYKEQIQTIKARSMRERDKFEATLQNSEESIRSKQALLTSTAESIREATELRERLYKQYEEEDSAKFSASECPTCHQVLPENKIAVMLENFNAEKAHKLEEIVEIGKRTVVKIADLQKQQDMIRAALASEEKHAETARKGLAAWAAQEQAELDKLPPLEEDPAFRDVRGKRDDLVRELSNLREGNLSLAPLEEALRMARVERETVQADIGRVQADLRTLRSIADLQEEQQKQRENADEASEVLRLISLFTQAKCSMLTEKVNSLFPGLEWRLFTRNIGNDNIVETCELLMHGIPYRDLSAGEKIRAGLIIVDTLQDKLQVRNPVFVDGAESITFRPEVKSQLILLKAREDINELKFEEV